MNPLEFERLILRLFEAMNLGRIATRGGRRAGIDALIVNRETGESSIIQAKHVQKTVPKEEVQRMARVMSEMEASKGIIVTNGTFSKSCFELAMDFGRIELIDGHKLWELAQEYLPSEVSSGNSTGAEGRDARDNN
jgi:restriction system protein